MPTCQAPTTPTEKAANLDLAKVTATSQGMNKLIAVALSCNMTRVYSHLWSGARDDNHYPIIQLDTEHHTLTHSTVQSEYDKAANVEKYIMSQYADLAQTLKDTPMGAGNLLDNTIIYGISDVAEPQGHVMKNYHIVLMGNAGGKIKGNRHYRKTGAQGDRAHAHAPASHGHERHAPSAAGTRPARRCRRSSPEVLTRAAGSRGLRGRLAAAAH